MNKLTPVDPDLIPYGFMPNRIAVSHVGHDGEFTFAYVVQNKHRMWLFVTVAGNLLAVSRRKSEVLTAAKVACPYWYLTKG